jgi:hypothetical protein
MNNLFNIQKSYMMITTRDVLLIIKTIIVQYDYRRNNMFYNKKSNETKKAILNILCHTK